MDNETLIKLYRTETDPKRLAAIMEMLDRSIDRVSGRCVGRCIAVLHKQATDDTQIIDLKEVA